MRIYLLSSYALSFACLLTMPIKRGVIQDFMGSAIAACLGPVLWPLFLAAACIGYSERHGFRGGDE